jgi:hypothetical protein
MCMFACVYVYVCVCVCVGIVNSAFELLHTLAVASGIVWLCVCACVCVRGVCEKSKR